MARRKKSWRDVLQVHPAAEMFPQMSRAELLELGKDIKKNGLRHKIVLWRTSNADEHNGDEHLFLLDGRNRLDAMELVGMRTVDHPGWDSTFAFTPQWELGTVHSMALGSLKPSIDPGVDPFEYVVSANLYRRHLTRAQRQQVIERLLKAKPERSDRATAKLARTSPQTVTKVRANLERRAQIEHVSTRTDSIGRRQPATRKPAEPKAENGHVKLTVAEKRKLVATDATAAATGRVMALSGAIKRDLAEAKSVAKVREHLDGDGVSALADARTNASALAQLLAEIDSTSTVDTKGEAG